MPNFAVFITDLPLMLARMFSLLAFARIFIDYAVIIKSFESLSHKELIHRGLPNFRRVVFFHQIALVLFTTMVIKAIAVAAEFPDLTTTWSILALIPLAAIYNVSKKFNSKTTSLVYEVLYANYYGRVYDN